MAAPMDTPGSASKETEFQTKVREWKPVMLRQAKEYSSNLPEEQTGFCGCYKLRWKCCPGCIAGFGCVLNCGCCVWMPSSMYLMDFFVMCFFCFCNRASRAWWHCVDLKGNETDLVKVDGERGTLACFSNNECCGASDDSKVESILYLDRCHCCC